MNMTEALSGAVAEHLKEFAQRSGEVLMSGIDTLRPGPFYTLGLNPSTCGLAVGEGTGLAVGDHARRWDLTSFSAYSEQCWRRDCWKADCFGRQVHKPVCTGHQPGTDKHQKAVMRLMGLLDQEPSRVLSTNAIFLASKGKNTFAQEHPCSIRQAWARCWQVHRFMLGIVRPRVIFCLGNGETDSAYSLLAHECVDRPVTNADASTLGFKWFDARFKDLEVTARVIGVFHPSRGYRIKDESRLTSLVAEAIA
jgi:hypothetical protein